MHVTFPSGVPTSIHRPLAQEIFMGRILAFRNTHESDYVYTAGANVHTMETVVRSSVIAATFIPLMTVH